RLERERLQDLLLALRAEACKRAETLCFRGLLQAGERVDPELTPDAGRGLRAEPWKVHEGDDVGRDERAPLRERVDVAGLDDLDDLLLDRLADALQLLRASVERQLRDGGR